MKNSLKNKATDSFVKNSFFKKRIDLDEVRNFIYNSPPETKVYIGTDSLKKKIHGLDFAEYATVIVVHKSGREGCKIFYQIYCERDYDKKKNKPALRLMNEVYRTAEMYLSLEDVLSCVETEIHLDVNPNEEHASSCVINEAIGYVRGVCNIVPLVKPDAFVATHAADHVVRHKSSFSGS